MSHCEDCGTKMCGRLCPNCDEEAVIMTEQAEDVGPVSREFAEKAEAQIRRRREEA